MLFTITAVELVPLFSFAHKLSVCSILIDQSSSSYYQLVPSLNTFGLVCLYHYTRRETFGTFSGSKFMN